MEEKLNQKINKDMGIVVSFFLGVGKIQGISSVFIHEVLVDSNGEMVAIVIGFDENFIEALFFDPNFPLHIPVFRSQKLFSIKISDSIIGRTLNSLGKPLDELGNIHGEERLVFTDAPSIIDRQPISDPLFTGIKVIDTNLPLGRGQREIIIGDHKLGKSTIAIDTVLNQKHNEKEIYCVYVVCGQKEGKLRKLISLFERENTFLYTCIVAATAKCSYAEQYLAPFVGCAIGEYFRDKQKDVLIVYDDLSKHAKTYRDIALLLERVPGREAYPGDIFSLHAGLLERAGKLTDTNGSSGGSISALPIVETQEGDITSFIPTNLISISDGQIYLEKGLFQKGFLPAINVGLSISRAGGKVQPKLLKNVIGDIRLSLSQHKELQKLSQLETKVSTQTQQNIKRGELILELLKQEKHTNIEWFEQVILFYIVENGFFDDIAEKKWKTFEILLLKLIRNRYFDILEKIKKGIFDAEVIAKINVIVEDFKQEFL